LLDENVSRKIVAAIAPGPVDHMLEIGPGFGALTKYLVESVEQLTVIEIDTRLRDRLSRFESHSNFKVRFVDFLDVDLETIAENHKLRVVGNIPYHITSQVIFKVFDEAADIVSDMTFMIQREVAERIVAKPRTKAYGILSVVSQLYSVPSILFNVSKNVFEPRPDVESAVVRWDLQAAPKFKVTDYKLLRRVIRATFNQRRKMLRKSLQQLPEFDKDTELDFTLERRPEELTVEEFVNLSNELSRV